MDNKQESSRETTINQSPKDADKQSKPSLFCCKFLLNTNDIVKCTCSHHVGIFHFTLRFLKH